MLSFREFKELEESESEQKASDVVRKGMNLQRGKDFWSDLISLCGNAEGMAELFDIPREKITALAGRINKLRSQIDNQESSKTKDKLIKTGDQI